MSSELRLKKLRGSGGYVMAQVSDQQQMKGNLGGPDLFLAPIGRIEKDKISKYFCNACEKEFEETPRIDYETPNEEVAENLILAERGQYACSTCNSTLAEYREFKKPDQTQEVGMAKPMQSETAATSQDASASTVPSPEPAAMSAGQDASGSERADETITPIQGMMVFDDGARKIGTARQVGVDAKQDLVLIVTQDAGGDISVPWNKIKKVGEVILLASSGTMPPSQDRKCPMCGFENKMDAKFCEECGNALA